MHAVKLFQFWIVILCCWQETQAKASIVMLNRTRVALAGDELEFSLKVVIPANSTSNLECYTQKFKIWSTYLNSTFVQIPCLVKATIKMHNSSSSGNYYFLYGNEKMHWVVRVKDKGYQEPPDELHSNIIIMMAFSGILLIFSVVGSLNILKNYKEQTPCRNANKEVLEQRPEESDDVITEEDARSTSLYTTLQHRSNSVYATLHPETTADEGNTRKNKSHIKDSREQDDVLDSVYENL